LLEDKMSTLALNRGFDSTATLPAGFANRLNPARPSALRALLTWLGDAFDRWTDDRADMERSLASAQNIVDLENRMRAALAPRTTMDF
jgi:hypothetical protein